MSNTDAFTHIKDVEILRRLKRTLAPGALPYAIANVIYSNVEGCDMVLSLFVAALNSYRSDKCLRPFPSYFMVDNVKDFCSLKRLCKSIPPLKEIVTKPASYPDDIFKFLAWLFMEKAFPTLLLIPFNDNILPSGLVGNLKPHYVFEVLHCRKVNAAFEARRQNRELILAYHGSHIDNFYSILKGGLQQHFSAEKITLYGEGIYLSSELSLCATFSPYSQTWQNSSLGKNHSVIAVCEIINDVQKVKFKDSKHKDRSLNENSTEEIPDKYFVVTDNDMVRLKYLLVYRKEQLTDVRSFFKKNLFWVILGLYFLMLILIGCRGTPWKKYIIF